MEYIGDNARFGVERVVLSEERCVEPLVERGETFPFGVRGMLPVSTVRRKKGGRKVVYAFPCAGGVACAGDDALSDELEDALAFLNALLGEAADLSGHGFGVLGAVVLGVPEEGYGFTRVEESLADGRTATPVRLRVETSPKPGEPESLGAVVEYDRDGRVRHVLMSDFGEAGYACRATAAVDFDDGELRIDRVVETRPGEEPYELYFWRRRSRWGN